MNLHTLHQAGRRAAVVWAAGLVLPMALAGQSPDFGAQWYQGQAEITSYTLEQARYGEVHDGHAVMIYVTEDFSRSKHVKLDRPSRAGDDAVKVLKLNATRNFNTGVYPYSMMSSIFVPVASGERSREALKITTSSQEWCGHTFHQLDRTAEGRYRVEARSYFEAEGDATYELDALTEDALWVTVRLDPEALPIGAVQLIPGTLFQRLGHIPWRAYEATAKRGVVADRDELATYTLTYPELGRTLTIHYTRAFPHTIEGWHETQTARGTTLTTRATRNQRMMLDYWSRNRLADEGLRAQLGLP